MTAKRMARDERRQQLLDSALALIREEGTAALTLARVAERAGVTKPIAYAHFRTRAGLLLALFQTHDERTGEAVRAALADGGGTIEEVAAIIAAAYVDCVLEIGPEFGAILDSLSASEETGDFRNAWRESLIGEFGAAFGSLLKDAPDALRPVLLGILGAAETLSEAAAAGRVSRAEAIGGLVRIMAGTLR